MLGTEIKEARWIESRSSCFIVLDEAGESSSTRMFVWDLLQDDSQPVQIKKIKKLEFFLIISFNVPIKNKLFGIFVSFCNKFWPNKFSTREAKRSRRLK